MFFYDTLNNAIMDRDPFAIKSSYKNKHLHTKLKKKNLVYLKFNSHTWYKWPDLGGGFDLYFSY